MGKALPGQLSGRLADAGRAFYNPVTQPKMLVEMAMPDPVDALILDLLEWIGGRPRPYAEVIEAWKTSCPRLPVWEEANARGLLEQRHQEGTGSFVSVSPAGRQWLVEHRIPGSGR